MITAVNKEMAKNIISTLDSAMISVDSEIANLEDTYKKMLEEAKAALTSQKEELEKQKSYWTSVLEDNATAPVEEKKTRKPRAKKVVEETVETHPSAEPEPEIVVDNLFPENNAPETVEDEGPEFDGAGFTDADNVVPEETDMSFFGEEPVETASEISSNEEQSEEEIKETEFNADEWPEMPEEWK